MFKKCLQNIIFVFISVVAVSGCTPSQKYLEKQGKAIITDDSAQIKVLLLKSNTPVYVSSKTRIVVTDMKTHKKLLNGKNKKLTFVPEKVNNSVQIESWDSPLSLNDKPYRGIIEIHNVNGKIFAVNVLRMEEYLQGVVSSEMSPSWPIEAIKAQAVAARTYAYYNLQDKNEKSIYDLDSTTKFQVYKGISAETDHTNQAVKNTAGVIMTYENKPILSVFHSTSGGRIIDNKYVWNGEDLPYLEDRVIPYGKSSPHYNWTYTLEMYQVKQLLSKRYSNVGLISGISFRKHQKRVVEVLITHTNGRIKMTGNEFRTLIGASKVKSQLFTAKRTGKSLILVGHGWGHGVGMCQYSAKEMAERGKEYKTILKYFYKDISIVKL